MSRYKNRAQRPRGKTKAFFVEKRDGFSPLLVKLLKCFGSHLLYCYLAPLATLACASGVLFYKTNI